VNAALDQPVHIAAQLFLIDIPARIQGNQIRRKDSAELFRMIAVSRHERKS